MFKFDFDLDDEDPGTQAEEQESLDDPIVSAVDSSKGSEPFAELSITELLDSLPPFISYSPLIIPIYSGDGTRTITLARRDLFDARFQLISEGAGDGLWGPERAKKEVQTREDNRNLALEFLDAPSDLVPKVYEGGLKTWECSLDLVDHLESMQKEPVTWKRILEIGCGTAVPSIYLLQQIFASLSNTTPAEETHIHLQDYNASVLELVTVPNIILAWYMSPASNTYRLSLPPHDSPDTDSDDEHPPPDPTLPSNLPLPHALRKAFLSTLTDHKIHLRLFSGSWEGLEASLAQEKGVNYDLVLTSETIYRLEGLDSLIKLMQRACKGFQSSAARLTSQQQEKLSLKAPVSDSQYTTPHPNPYLCLIAAKVLYFGVGGGISEFIRAAEDGIYSKGEVRVVWEKSEGVKRRVMEVKWI